MLLSRTAPLPRRAVLVAPVVLFGAVLLPKVAAIKAKNTSLVDEAPEGKTSNQPTRQDIPEHLRQDAGTKSLKEMISEKDSHNILNTFQSGKDASKVVGVKMNANKEDTPALQSALATATLVGACCVLGFLVLAQHFPEIYAHRAREEAGLELPMPSRTPLGWAIAANSIEAEKVVEMAGLDGLMMTEFHALCHQIVSFIGPWLILVLCPLHYCWSATPEGQEDLSIYLRLGMTSLDEETLHTGAWMGDWGGLLLRTTRYFHALSVWFVVIMCSHFIMQAHLAFLQYRFEWLRRIPVPRATTLLVEAIPGELNTDGALRAYFAKMFSESAIERTYVVRRTRELRRRVHWMQRCKNDLEAAEATWEAAGHDPASRPQIRTCWCFGEQKDAIEEYTRLLEIARQDVASEREANERMEEKELCSRSALVTFASRRWCRLACKEQFRADDTEFVKSMAPDPDDVVYDDLAKDARERSIGNWTARFLVSMVFLLFMPTVVCVSNFTNYEHLVRICPWIADYPNVEGMIRGPLATVVLTVFMCLLPSILFYIVKNFQTLKANSWCQMHVQRSQYMFQVIFILLAIMVNKSLVTAVLETAQSPLLVIEKLADELPMASHFYINYVIIGWMPLGTELLRLPFLAGFITMVAIKKDREEARKAAEKTEDNGMGYRMALPAFMMTLTLVFCTVCPMITVFAWLYFTFGGTVYRYLLVYAEPRHSDLGGAFWVQALKQLMLGEVMFILLMSGILLKAESPGAAALTAASLLWVFNEYQHFTHIIWETLPFEEIAETDHKAAAAAQAWKSKALRPSTTFYDFDLYTQAECNAKLDEGSSKSGSDSDKDKDRVVDTEKAAGPKRRSCPGEMSITGDPGLANSAA